MLFRKTGRSQPTSPEFHQVTVTPKNSTAIRLDLLSLHNSIVQIQLHQVSNSIEPLINATSITMASNTTAADAGLPPDLFDQTTLVSLASTILILAVAYATSLKALAPSTPGSYRFLFIWHAFDALIHFFLEGSFLYHASHTSQSASQGFRQAY